MNTSLLVLVFAIGILILGSEQASAVTCKVDCESSAGVCATILPSGAATCTTDSYCTMLQITKAITFCDPTGEADLLFNAALDLANIVPKKLQDVKIWTCQDSEMFTPFTAFPEAIGSTIATGMTAAVATLAPLGQLNDCRTMYTASLEGSIDSSNGDFTVSTRATYTVATNVGEISFRVCDGFDNCADGFTCAVGSNGIGEKPVDKCSGSMTTFSALLLVGCFLAIKLTEE